jgi:serine/threonine protein kinase
LTPTKIGKYGIVGVLGRGASEEVCLGEYGGRRVAIRLFASLSGAERDRLVEEARKIAGLSHPNIAFQEIGVHEDQPFLVAEMSGATLAKWLAESQSLANQLAVIEGICEALTYAHSHGVFHRGLTLGSVQVTPEGDARVWNFGLSMLKPEKAALPYVAPEIVEGQAASAQSDLYSAGIVFYEMLTGQAPAAGDPATAKPIRDIKGDVPRDLSDAIMACRERAADWRPKDLSYLLEVVRTLRGASGPRTRAVPPPTMAAAPALRRAAPERSGPPLALIAAAAVLLVGGGAAFYFMRGRGETKRAEVTATTALPTTTLTPTPEPTAATTPAVAARPTPTPATTPTPAAAVRPTATPEAARLTPTPPPPPTTAVVARPTPPPTTAPPATTLPPATTAPPATSVAAAPTPPPAVVRGVPLLRALSPPMLKRGQTMLVDVRGSDLYPQLSATLLKGKGPAAGLRVARSRFVNDTLIQVFIEVDPSAAPGQYAVVLAEGGNSTNTLRFDVAK